MARRFDADAWDLAPPVVDGELVGGFVGIRGCVRWFGGPAVTRLPTDLVVPLGGRVTQSEAPTTLSEDHFGINIKFPPDGASDTEIVLPFIQFVPYLDAIWFFFASHDPSSGGLTGGNRAQAYAREVHGKIKRGTRISGFGWGDGPAASRRLRGNAAGTLNNPGLGPIYTLEADVVGAVEQLTVGSVTTRLDSGGIYTTLPPAGAPSRFRGSKSVRNAVWGFFVDVKELPTRNIDYGPSNAIWTPQNKSPTARTWTDLHPRANAGNRTETRYAVYSATAGVPFVRTYNSQGLNACGGLIGQAAAFYTPIMGNLTQHRGNPTGEGVPISQARKGNLGTRNEANAVSYGLVVDRVGRNPAYYLFADLAVFLDLAGDDYRPGQLTRNYEDVRRALRKPPTLQIDYAAGEAADVENLNLLVGRTVAAAPAASTVFDYSGMGFDGDEELRFRATLEEERWTGAAYDDDGSVVANPVHRVTLKVVGVGQWTNLARLGLNGRTYYIDDIRGGGRLRRDEWVVRASAEFEFPAAEA